MAKQKFSSAFRDIKVIGELTSDEMANKLRKMGDYYTAKKFDEEFKKRESKDISVRRYGDKVIEYRKFKPKKYNQRSEPKYKRIVFKQVKSKVFTEEVSKATHHISPKEKVLIRKRKPWEYSTHKLGYFPFRGPKDAHTSDIKDAGAIEPDKKLRNSRIDIRLDRLRVWKYPGSFLGRSGEHHVLINFVAQNQLPGNLQAEPISFSQTYQVNDGEFAGVQGYPIFIGLNVGNQGALFEICTVNVKNSADEAFLKILDSPVFRNGLNLLTTVQPVLKPFTEIAGGIAKMFAERDKNVAVQKFYFGLDFTRGGAGAALAQGEYIAVQVPFITAINWDDWVWDFNIGAIVSKDDQTVSLPYNYIIFRVTLYDEYQLNENV